LALTLGSSSKGRNVSFEFNIRVSDWTDTEGDPNDPLIAPKAVTPELVSAH
jgi:hypothetical protein